MISFFQQRALMRSKAPIVSSF